MARNGLYCVFELGNVISWVRCKNGVTGLLGRVMKGRDGFSLEWRALTTYKKELPKIGKISVVVRRCFQPPGADPVDRFQAKQKPRRKTGA